MKYGDALRRGFRALRSGALWGFAATASLAVAAPLAVSGAVALTAFRGVTVPAAFIGSEGAVVADFLKLYLVLFAGGLLAIPIVIITRGGYVHLTDGVIAGRPVGVGESWSFGLTRFWRTLGIDFAFVMLMIVAMTVVMIPFAALLVAGIAGGVAGAQSSRALSGLSAVGAICCGYIYLIGAIFALVLVYTGVEQVAMRYGLIGGRTFGDSISCSWQAFKSRKRNFILFALIMAGLGYAYQTVTSLVTAPLYFVLIPSSVWQSMLNPSVRPDVSTLSGFTNGTFLLLYPLLLILMVPWMVFTHAAWTAFFRQLTGLDLPPAPTAYTAYTAYPPSSELPPPVVSFDRPPASAGEPRA